MPALVVTEWAGVLSAFIFTCACYETRAVIRRTVAFDADQLDDGRGQIPERTRGGRRAGPHYCCAKSPRGTKAPHGSRHVVSRPMSYHTVHYMITEEGRRALGDVQWR